MITEENNFSDNKEDKNSIQENQEHKDAEIKDQTAEKPVLEETESNLEHDFHDQEEEVDDQNAVHMDPRSIETLVGELNKILGKPNAGAEFKEFHQIRDLALAKINEEKEERKSEYLQSGKPEEDFEWEHKLLRDIHTYTNSFKEKHQHFLKHQEEEHAHNLEVRRAIVEKLKHLYTNTEPGTNLFKAIREIKEEWKNSGQVSKSQFKLLNNDYFHHLNQFYQMLDLNKEYLDQEYAHNLETRKHIIQRAKELENEPVVQKALNELQYLHKLWKEEAEPVAEEVRESTWEEFREVSNKIHLRKSELSAQIEQEQSKNLELKNQIIAKIKEFANPQEKANHQFWQNAIKKVEELRTDFLKIGGVPRKLSNQNWTEFKTGLRAFNAKKNEFYKGLKGNQQTNLEEKLKLIKTAQDNMQSEDWETTVPLFKKLQEDWKNIGHVPRSMTNKVWEDFRTACNTFFDNFREKNAATTDNWKENFKQKKLILEELKNIIHEEGSQMKIEALKTAWNNIGKVPRDKMSINTEFNKTLREKLKLNNINEFELKEEGLSEIQMTDKARKIKNQISELEAEVAKLENNISFFSNASADNPLLKDTFLSIESKKEQIENLKESLHNIITGE